LEIIDEFDLHKVFPRCEALFDGRILFSRETQSESFRADAQTEIKISPAPTPDTRERDKRIKEREGQQ